MKWRALSKQGTNPSDTDDTQDEDEKEQGMKEEQGTEKEEGSAPLRSESPIGAESVSPAQSMPVSSNSAGNGDILVSNNGSGSVRNQNVGNVINTIIIYG